MIGTRGALPYQLLADAVLALHVALVVFVVGGLVLVIAGNVRQWRWVNQLWFRLAHLLAIAVVAAESWFDVVCPLTSFEMWLRVRARGATYSGSFIEHWLQRLLYYDAPPWVFIAGYSVFALLVAGAWWFYPPQRPGRPSARPRSRSAGGTTAPGQGEQGLL